MERELYLQNGLVIFPCPCPYSAMVSTVDMLILADDLYSSLLSPGLLCSLNNYLIYWGLWLLKYIPNSLRKHLLQRRYSINAEEMNYYNNSLLLNE